jgi:N-acetylmuramoyl-L-alanine amidase
MLVHQLHMKFKNAALVVGFAILCLQTSSAWAGKSPSSEDLYYLAQKSYYKFKGSPDKQQFRHHWEKVIQQFSKVVDRHPKSPQAYKAVFTMARLYQGLNGVSKNSKDLDQALRYYKKVSRDFSKGTLTDDALFESAEIYLNKKDFSSAAGILKTIFEKYPSGDQAKKARLEYQKLASTSPVLKKTPVIQPVNKKPVVLSKKKKPEPKIVKQTVSQVSKKLTVLTKEKKTEPVVVKQVLATPPKSLKQKKIISKPHLASQEKKAVKPDSQKKRVVASKSKPSTQAPVEKVYFKKSKKGKKGHLYTPSSGRDKKSAPLIVVDAGHGGKDQGAKSAGGIHEKNVNLTISRHVKTILVNRFKYRVVMTRKDDTFIPLKERSEIANNRNADLFVSIHANAAKRKSAHGIETYFLGTTNNDRALETAARENGELVHSVKDDQVQEILASLITTTKINDSSRLAGTVQENLFRSTRKKFRALKNLGVKEGPFYVLHGADMPSILVEVGFLTNRKESRMLSKPDYLYRLASSIAEGIHKYLQDKGPSI